ncbi:serine hydrolase [Fulvivirga sp. M361]|uniref:serine hydrolase domain-containing protein n=1 Tax=Fulvivirga sp. M361 TaxID=2594266 RepID=UPI0016240122|nr:serine hydrolase domain-containing protein [Fulvivirga sp. M361]
MKRHTKQCFLAISYLLFLTSCGEQINSTDETAIFEKTDEYVENMMDSLEIIGLNYAILINGKLVHKKAMGLANLEHQVPMTLDNLFAVASISKLISSTALHRLLKIKGRSVHETVGEFLPTHRDLPESWRDLTLKHLLTHTSGIPDQIDYQIYLAPESDQFVIEALKDKPFSSIPGDATKYNATGFMLVRMIFEELAGQDFETHMQENYFDKLNLTTANYGGFKKVVPKRVTSYRKTGGKLEMFPLAYAPPMYAAAGLNISLHELVIWIQAVLNEEIVSKEQLDSIWTPAKLNNDNVGPFGLGWETRQLENGVWLTGHGGAGISSIRHYWKDDTQKTVTVILLTNGARNWIQMPDDVNMGIANHFIPGITNLN